MRHVQILGHRNERLVMSDGVVDDGHLGTLAIQINHRPQPYKRRPVEIFMVCKHTLKQAVLNVQFHNKNKSICKRWLKVIVQLW